MTVDDRFVLMRLEGPMQSWGNHSRGSNGAHRTSHTRPTKSGVIGLVANALGRDYRDGIADLADLTFGVRTDVPGRLEVDFHMTGAGEFPLLPGEAYRNRKWFSRIASGRFCLDEGEYAAAAAVSYDATTSSLVARAGHAVVTHDWYIADASFVAVLIGPPTVVDAIASSLANPRRPMYLGRRAYLPSRPILIGSGDASEPTTALGFPPRAVRTPPGPVPAWIEPMRRGGGAPSRAVPVGDQPLSFGGPTARAARLEVATHVDPAEMCSLPAEFERQEHS